MIDLSHDTPAPAPTTLIGRLTELLRKELDHHRELLVIGNGLTAAVVANDRDRLRQAVERQRACQEQGDALRRSREDLLAACGRHLGLPGAKVRLTAVLARAGEGERRAADAVRSELTRVLADLKRTTERNQMLLRTGLGIVHDLMDLIAGPEQRSAYDRRGRASERRHGAGGMLNLRG